MKQTLLCLFLFVFALGFSKNTPVESTANPAIGIQMTGQMFGNMVSFQVKIKNIGEETLTNINITLSEQTSTPGSLDPINLIATLAPGQETSGFQVTKYSFTNCFDQTQLIVHATTLLGNEITDLSSDTYGHDNNGLPGTYYNDIPNYSYDLSIQLSGSQDGIYQDTNANNIVDVGDVVNYSYDLQSFGVPPSGEIVDNNAIIVSPSFTLDFSTTSYHTTGIHYLTQTDIDLGYVYNSSYVLSPESCQGSYSLQDQSYCSGCPNPGGANVVTKLTSLLPNKISGSVKFNANNDCATAFNFRDRRVTTTDGTNNYATYTNTSGNYGILIPNGGSYTTAALGNLGANFSSDPMSVLTNSSGDNVDYTNTNFCISSSTNYADLRVNLFNINQAIPGFDANYRLYYENLGSTNLNGTVKLTVPADVFLNFSLNPLPNDFTAVTLTWNYTNLLPFERRYIELGFLVNASTVHSGDVLTLTAEGTPTVGDNNLANNTFTLNQTVFSSFDPNDKTVLEGSSITANQATGYLNYVTRFQNTGTANATTVVVKETLDADLDCNTFEPVDASHTNNIQIRNGNELTYTFSNINLAFESANEPASHGWLAYRIKPKNTFAIGDAATSLSAIYFDFNPPVLTNEVSTSIAPLTTSRFMKDQFTVYPNPAKNFITIENKANLTSQFEIISCNGQSLMKSQIESSKAIDISRLSNGFYLLTLQTSEGSATYKFIKN